MKSRFEIGKAYQHPSGMQMFICGMADTALYGPCFIAETGWDREKEVQRIDDLIKGAMMGIPVSTRNKYELQAISMKDDAIENWTEIPKEDFISNNFC